MKYILHLALFLFVALTLSCKKEKDTTPTTPVNPINPDLAVVRTDSVVNIGFRSARVHSSVVSEGRSAVTANGIVWATTPNPTTFNNILPATGFGVGSFPLDIVDLSPNTTYYVRTYATNAVGTAYSEQKVFATLAENAPGVSIDSAFDISFRSAKVKGNVTETGSSAVSERGFVWSAAPDPLLATGNKLQVSSGLGEFESQIDGISLGTRYYVKSYATNNEGTAYSPQITFTTNPPQLPTVTTAEVSNITAVSARVGGSIISEGSGAITGRGVVYGANPNPTISNSVLNLSGNPSFSGQLTNLNSGASYFMRAFARNDAGIAYGDQKVFTTPGLFVAGSGVTDVDGNSYATIIINGQEWMKENLKVSKYRNGVSIPTGLSISQWTNTRAGAYAIYENEPANNLTYGKLYNWYAVADSRGLCPAGWHVPSNDEVASLEAFLGGFEAAGGKMKAVSSLWTSPNNGATNESGFTGLPGGIYYGGQYDLGSRFGIWWTNTEIDAENVYDFFLINDQSGLYQIPNAKINGLSIRCLKD